MYNFFYLQIIISLQLTGCGNKMNMSEYGTQGVVTNNKTISVSTSNELKNALLNAKAGDSIIISDGVYQGNFKFTNNGTSLKRTILSGSRNAILDGVNINSGYVLYITASNILIKGITIQNGKKGIMVDGANNITIDSVLVTKTGEEGIHFRGFSSHNTIQNSTVNHTGLVNPGYGEGIYIGSAKNNWAKYSGGKPDNSDNNQIINNIIGPFVKAECIDIKEGTTGGLIKGNRFYSEGINGENSADSWIDVKGNNYLIENNDGYNTSGTPFFTDGYQVNCAYPGWGNNNVFKSNRSQINSSGYAINVRLKSSNGEVTGTIVYSDNTATGAAAGVTNISITQ